MQSARQIHKRMEELYVSFITDKNVRERLYELLQLLFKTREGATLFHCFAGKDRTGITAAVQSEAVQEAVLAALSVEQRYLETSFETAKQEYGSFENYISKGIGLEEGDWERMRGMYLTD